MAFYVKKEVQPREARQLTQTNREDSDKELEALFSDDAESLKKGFKEEEANGHIYIGSEGCDGFDPVTGCHGHPD